MPPPTPVSIPSSTAMTGFRPNASAFCVPATAKIARHRGMKKAIVALARRLAVIMHRIWVDRTEFRWTREVVAA